MAVPVLDAEKVGNTRTLAEFLVGLEYDDIPASVVEQAKIFTLEAVGHIVHAHAQPVSQLPVNYARELAAAPQASILGTDLKTSVAMGGGPHVVCRTQGEGGESCFEGGHSDGKVTWQGWSRVTPLCQDQVRHQGQPLLVELEG